MKRSLFTLVKKVINTSNINSCNIVKNTEKHFVITNPWSGKPLSKNQEPCNLKIETQNKIIAEITNNYVK